MMPDPRIAYRVILIPLAFGAVAALDMPQHLAELSTLIAVAGMALWAVPANGEEFLSLKGHDDSHGTNGYEWIFRICCKILGVTLEQKLTPAQTCNWGTLYGCILGMFEYPMFAALGYLLTPWAFLIGATCFAQGFVYRFCGSVKVAEFVNGALIGARFALILIAFISIR